MADHFDFLPLDIVENRTPAQKLSDGDALFEDLMQCERTITYRLKYKDWTLPLTDEDKTADTQDVPSLINLISEHVGSHDFCRIILLDGEQELGRGYYYASDEDITSLLLEVQEEQGAARELAQAVNAEYARMVTPDWLRKSS